METPADEAYLKRQETKLFKRLEKEFRRREPSTFLLGFSLYSLSALLGGGLWLLFKYAAKG